MHHDIFSVPCRSRHMHGQYWTAQRLWMQNRSLSILTMLCTMLLANNAPVCIMQVILLLHMLGLLLYMCCCCCQDCSMITVISACWFCKRQMLAHKQTLSIQQLCHIVVSLALSKGQSDRCSRPQSVCHSDWMFRMLSHSGICSRGLCKA